MAKTIASIESQIEILASISNNKISAKRHADKAKSAKLEIKELCANLGVSLAEVKAFDPDSKIVAKFNAATEKLNLLAQNKSKKEKTVSRFLVLFLLI